MGEAGQIDDVKATVTSHRFLELFLCPSKGQDI